MQRTSSDSFGLIIWLGRSDGAWPELDGVFRVQAPRMKSIMERWIGSCRRELLDRTLIWNQRHLMIVLRGYEDFYSTHRPHRALNQPCLSAPARQR